MKKLIAVILLGIFFTVNTGFVISLHYCMDRFAGADLGDSRLEKCGKCGMNAKEKSDCCHNELELVKLKQDITAATYTVVHLGLAPALLPKPIAFFLPVASSIHAISYRAHAPPLLSRQDTYLRHCVFRI